MIYESKISQIYYDLNIILGAKLNNITSFDDGNELVSRAICGEVIIHYEANHYTQGYIVNRISELLVRVTAEWLNYRYAIYTKSVRSI